MRQFTFAAHLDGRRRMMALLTPLEEKGVLVRRSRELLENEVDRFNCYRNAMAPLSLARPLIQSWAKRFYFRRTGVALAVSPIYRGSNRGERLLKGIEQAAKKNTRASYTFLVNHSSSSLFIERGFSEQPTLAKLTNTKNKHCTLSTYSKIFSKAL